LLIRSENRDKLLYDLVREISSSLVADEVLSSMVESIARAIGAKGCSLMLLTPDRKQLIHTISYGLSSQYLKKGPVRAGAIISEVLEGRPVAITDITEDPRIQYKEQTIREGIASLVSVPLMPRGEVIGTLRVYTSEPHQFSTEEIDFLSALANLGAMALEKARLYESLGRSLEQRSEEVNKLEEEKTKFLRFLSIAAHDLKAPLAAIQSYIGVMLGGYTGELTEKQKNMLERSSYRITELLTLISDLLDIPRIETGQIVQEMKEISLRQVVRNCLQEQRRLAKEKGIRLKVELPEALPKIRGSSPRLQQVITNLVNNAINYTAEGTVTVRLTEENNDIIIEIIDTGIGIPPEDLTRVFDDFFRGSNVEVKGTGLGLAITKRIIEAHGGQIHVESPCSENNTGSKFTCVLPRNY